jgi:hypothetical protein
MGLVGPLKRRCCGFPRLGESDPGKQGISAAQVAFVLTRPLPMEVLVSFD